jgi:ankyrin repeat protein
MTGQQLIDAASDGHAAKVRTLLSTQGVQSFINYQDPHGATPLHAAAVKGHAAITKQLIAARCNVDLQEHYAAATPLHVAAQEGHDAVAKQLLAASCDVNLQTKLGFTPLHYAAGEGHETTTKQLVAARCNVDHQDKDGFTPLHLAASQGHEAVTTQLLAALCNVHLQANDGATALQLAEECGHAGIATLLRNRKQETPLLGSRLVITGLVAKPELNRLTGTAVRFDDDKGRYSVELDGTASSLMIKPCNLLPTPVCSVALCCLLFSHVQTRPRLS